MVSGDLAIIAPKFGESVAWHPACFVCNACDELLVDLTYCARETRLFCERHYAEQLKPRCSACDEVRLQIFLLIKKTSSYINVTFKIRTPVTNLG